MALESTQLHEMGGRDGERLTQEKDSVEEQPRLDGQSRAHSQGERPLVVVVVVVVVQAVGRPGRVFGRQRATDGVGVHEAARNGMVRR